MRAVSLRSRIEALERRATRDAPALAVVDLYEDDDEAAAERWLSEFDASAPHGVAVVIRLALPRPPGRLPFWASAHGGQPG
ncbi:hypothetical protein [Pyxidicoccus trucidator]|uniref:hypothetical protein n=1 Tax=Pyxidicoccus trucidator TaxID=2709662 RepID=UPI0013DC7861|nr:hypothetical protein [Pyxidicoccus trucidator]